MKNPFEFPATYIDTGFWKVSKQTAGKLCKKAGLPIPKMGYQLLLQTSRGEAWLTRTPVKNVWVWAVYLRVPPEYTLDRIAWSELNQ